MTSLVARMLMERVQVGITSLCTNDTCDISKSYYAYRLSLAANAVFLALFAISLLGFLLTFAFTRRAFGFTVAMACGIILEVIGYAGRIMSWNNQFTQNGFLIQIVCLTIAPAFMAAGIYLTLRRIVITLGPENSRIKPETYTRFFIPCDLVSLVLQALGGGIASAASHSGKSPDLGDHIMVAGLSFQVLTLLIFMGLCVDFAIRTRRRYLELGSAALNENPIFVSLRNSMKFKTFVAALGLATLCIFIRSVYRVAELGQGWTGYLIQHQWYFVGFEGSLVALACLILNVCHPAITFKEGMVGAGGIGSRWRKNKGTKDVGSGLASTSGSDRNLEAASKEQANMA